MRVIGYLEHLDLRVDPDSGERNILVQSAQEFQALSPDKRERAWATISVASQILEVQPQAIYKSAYNGVTPFKIVKKNELDRRGLNIVKIPSVPKTKAVRRDLDISRIVRVLRRSMKATRWLPASQGVLIGALVDMNLRGIERELFGKGIKEGSSHEQAEV